MSDIRLRFGLLLCLTVLLFSPPDAHAALERKTAVSAAAACNPQPEAEDIVLPMPCGLSMAFRLVAVPAKGLLWDMPLRPGLDDSAHQDRAFYDRRYNAALSGALTWRTCPRPGAPRPQG